MGLRLPIANANPKRAEAFQGFLTALPLFAMWPIALLPKGAQLVALALFAGLLVLVCANRSVWRLSAASGALAAVLCVHIVSVAWNSGTFDPARTIAAIGTVGSWGIALVYFTVCSNSDLDLSIISRAAFVNMALLVVCALIAPYANATISVFGGTRMATWNGRLFAFFEYANLVPYTYLFCFPLSLLFVRGWKSMAGKTVFVLLCATPVVLSGSRMAAVLVFATTLVAEYYLLETHSKVAHANARIIYCVGCLLGMLASLLLVANVGSALDSLLASREGSNITRFRIYKESIEAFFGSPLIGVGVKGINPDVAIDIPLGSHSTYIGVLYKVGLLGAAFCALALASVLVAIGKSSNRRKVYAFAWVVLTAAYFSIEDIDGAYWALSMAAVATGVVFRKLVRTASQSQNRGLMIAFKIVES